MQGGVAPLLQVPQDVIISDGRFLYCVSAREHIPRALRRETATLPSHAPQLRPESNPVTVYKFDPREKFAQTHTVTLSNPRSLSHSAKVYVRQCVAFAKDNTIDLGDPEPVLSIPSGFITIEAWVKVHRCLVSPSFTSSRCLVVCHSVTLAPASSA